MKTISRRAAKKIDAVREAVTAGMLYSIHNDFIAKPIVNMDYVWETLERNPSSRLIDNEDGTYTIEVHGNLWYKLRKS